MNIDALKRLFKPDTSLQVDIDNNNISQNGKLKESIIDMFDQETVEQLGLLSKIFKGDEKVDIISEFKCLYDLILENKEVNPYPLSLIKNDLLEMFKRGSSLSPSKEDWESLVTAVFAMNKCCNSNYVDNNEYMKAVFHELYMSIVHIAGLNKDSDISELANQYTFLHTKSSHLVNDNKANEDWLKIYAFLYLIYLTQKETIKHKEHLGYNLAHIMSVLSTDTNTITESIPSIKAEHIPQISSLDNKRLQQDNKVSGNINNKDNVFDTNHVSTTHAESDLSNTDTSVNNIKNIKQQIFDLPFTIKENVHNIEQNVEALIKARDNLQKLKKDHSINQESLTNDNLYTPIMESSVKKDLEKVVATNILKGTDYCANLQSVNQPDVNIRELAETSTYPDPDEYVYWKYPNSYRWYNDWDNPYESPKTDYPLERFWVEPTVNAKSTSDTIWFEYDTPNEFRFLLNRLCKEQNMKKALGIEIPLDEEFDSIESLLTNPNKLWDMVDHKREWGALINIISRLRQDFTDITTRILEEQSDNPNSDDIKIAKYKRAVFQGLYMGLCEFADVNGPYLWMFADSYSPTDDIKDKISDFSPSSSINSELRCHEWIMFCAFFKELSESQQPDLNVMVTMRDDNDTMMLYKQLAKEYILWANSIVKHRGLMEGETNPLDIPTLLFSGTPIPHHKKRSVWKSLVCMIVGLSDMCNVGLIDDPHSKDLLYRVYHELCTAANLPLGSTIEELEHVVDIDQALRSLTVPDLFHLMDEISKCKEEEIEDTNQPVELFYAAKAYSELQRAISSRDNQEVDQQVAAYRILANEYVFWLQKLSETSPIPHVWPDMNLEDIRNFSAALDETVTIPISVIVDEPTVEPDNHVAALTTLENLLMDLRFFRSMLYRDPEFTSSAWKNNWKNNLHNVILDAPDMRLLQHQLEATQLSQSQQAPFSDASEKAVQLLTDFYTKVGKITLDHHDASHENDLFCWALTQDSWRVTYAIKDCIRLIELDRRNQPNNFQYTNEIIDVPIQYQYPTSVDTPGPGPEHSILHFEAAREIIDVPIQYEYPTSVDTPEPGPEHSILHFEAALNSIEENGGDLDINKYGKTWATFIHLIYGLSKRYKAGMIAPNNAHLNKLISDLYEGLCDAVNLPRDTNPEQLADAFNTPTNPLPEDEESATVKNVQFSDLFIQEMRTFLTAVKYITYQPTLPVPLYHKMINSAYEFWPELSMAVLEAKGGLLDHAINKASILGEYLNNTIANHMITGKGTWDIQEKIQEVNAAIMEQFKLLDNHQSPQLNLIQDSITNLEEELRLKSTESWGYMSPPEGTGIWVNIKTLKDALHTLMQDVGASQNVPKAKLIDIANLASDLVSAAGGWARTVADNLKVTLSEVNIQIQLLTNIMNRIAGLYKQLSSISG